MAISPVGKGGPVVQPDKAAELNQERLNQGQKAAERKPAAHQGELEKAFARLEQVAYIFDRRFHFKVHEETKRYYVQIIDQATGKVINEVPPEKILDLVAQIQKLVGLLMDQQA